MPIIHGRVLTKEARFIQMGGRATMDSLSTGIGTIVCFTRMTNLSEENLTSMALRVSGVFAKRRMAKLNGVTKHAFCVTLKESEIQMESQREKTSITFY